jgi:hypothetical protein
MNFAESMASFSALAPQQQLRLLTRFGHNLTTAARDTYVVGADTVRFTERLRAINEVQHDVCLPTCARFR